MKFKARAAGAAVLALVFGETAGVAQQAVDDVTYLADSASPFTHPPKPVDGEPVEVPALAFTADGTEAADFDKYYAFHRDGTDYETAFADLVECDSYARGLMSGVDYAQPVYPYDGTMAGALGGALASALVMAIFGSAEKRRMRRVNMRTCMNYKGYDRFGLPKSVWDTFNFEEGLSGMKDDKRYVYLRQQAMVASSGQLQGKALGL